MVADSRLSHCQGQLTEHFYDTLYDCMEKILVTNEWFIEVRDYVIRLEFQGRKTVHIHVAAWAVVRAYLVGRTGGERSGFVRFLEDLFGASVDVQIGSGFLNCISGYVVKGSSSMDFNPEASSPSLPCCRFFSVSV